MARGGGERGEEPGLTRFWAWFPILPLAEPGERRYTAKIARERPHCLDIRALAAMFAQPLGSLSHSMRNIISKLLIIVVPRRTAGGG